MILAFDEVKDAVQRNVDDTGDERKARQSHLKAQTRSDAPRLEGQPPHAPADPDHGRVDDELQSDSWHGVPRERRLGDQRPRFAELAGEERYEHVEEEDGADHRDQQPRQDVREDRPAGRAAPLAPHHREEEPVQGHLLQLPRQDRREEYLGYLERDARHREVLPPHGEPRLGRQEQALPHPPLALPVPRYAVPLDTGDDPAHLALAVELLDPAYLRPRRVLLDD
mmetsp:Transcript_34967/g.79830  ORF Transcript_34967/g.79830 Transcript_34967/m.79830 type:complete len:225 (-) Transcript_34967:1500-2174(-)